MTKPAPVAAKPEPAADVEVETTSKSIIDPKYRTKYKNRKEFLSDLLKSSASTTKDYEAVAAVGKEGEEGYKPAKEARSVVTGVDVDKLFAIGAENGLDLSKYEAQRDGHGFPGCFRMTVGNMLRAVIKQRHGFMFNGEWQEAPQEWLDANKAPTEPTHEQDGTKIAKAKPAAETEAAPSKLIKAETKPAAAASPTKAVAGKKK